MKYFKYITMALAGCAFLITSCTDMDKDYKEFIKDGEIVYRAKADSIKAYSGRNRALLIWKLKYPILVTKCQIREGNEVLAEVPVAYEDSIEFSHILTGLDEKTHTFSVYSLDADGNSSIKNTVIVEVFGDRYISTLRTSRLIQEVLTSVDNPKNNLLVLNNISSSKVVGTDVYYTTTSGTKKSVRLKVGTNSTVIENADISKGFQLADLWIPTETAIDTFPAPQKVFLPANISVKSARTFVSLFRGSDNSIAVKLSPVSGIKKSVLKYGDQEMDITPETTSLKLENVPAGANFSITTIVHDAASGKDFSTPAIVRAGLDIPSSKISMTGWSVIEYSSQQESGEGAGGGHASHAIDGDINTYWHTQYSPTSSGFPHYLTVDMQEVTKVTGIAVARRQGNTNFASLMKLEVSTDGTNWINAGNFSPVNSINEMQLFIVTPITGRYFRLTALTNATTAVHTCISEINLYK